MDNVPEPLSCSALVLIAAVTGRLKSSADAEMSKSTRLRYVDGTNNCTSRNESGVPSTSWNATRTFAPIFAVPFWTVTPPRPSYPSAMSISDELKVAPKSNVRRISSRPAVPSPSPLGVSAVPRSSTMLKSRAMFSDTLRSTEPSRGLPASPKLTLRVYVLERVRSKTRLSLPVALRSSTIENSEEDKPNAPSIAVSREAKSMADTPAPTDAGNLAKKVSRPMPVAASFMS